MAKTRGLAEQYVICISNEGYAASLEPRKIYQAVADAAASRERLMRVIDESGEDYLFPAELFVPIDLDKDIKAALRRAS